MCLATPMKIIRLNGKKAVVEAPRHIHEVDISLIKNPQEGDYVFAHGELAVHKIPEEEALKIMEFIAKYPHEH